MKRQIPVFGIEKLEVLAAKPVQVMLKIPDLTGEPNGNKNDPRCETTEPCQGNGNCRMAAGKTGKGLEQPSLMLVFP